MTPSARLWLTQLAQVSSLTNSLDYDSTLRKIVRLPIPTLADWCMVYVPDDGGPLPARMAVAHTSPMKEALLRKVWNREWSLLPEVHPIIQSLRSRSPVVITEADPGILDTLSLTSEDAALLQRVGVQSLLVLPLVAHGTLLGAVMLVASRTRSRAYDHAVLELFTELARCCAQSLYNARLLLETRLALRLRDELIISVTRQMLELAEGTAPLADWRALAPQIERLANHLQAAIDPFGFR